MDDEENEPDFNALAMASASQCDISGLKHAIQKLSGTGKSPSKDVFLALLEGCGSRQALPEVADYFAELLQDGVLQPRTCTTLYKNLIIACAESSPPVPELAKRLLNDARRPGLKLGKASFAALKEVVARGKAMSDALKAKRDVHMKRYSELFGRLLQNLGARAQWHEAMRLMGEMHELGFLKHEHFACQRLISKLDVADGDPQEVALLDSIMRLALGQPPAQMSKEDFLGLAEQSMTRLPAFRAGEASPQAPEASRPDFEPGSWSVLHHVPARRREPPNHYDLNIYSCAPGVLALDAPLALPVEQHPVPRVDGASVLSNVLSAAECSALIAASERMGYRPDLPLTEAEYDGRAESVVLLASEEQSAELFRRVRAQLPGNLDGDKLLGLNRRWRLYRYLEGSVYRKHLDGAWPSSGERINSHGKREYVFDVEEGRGRGRGRARAGTARSRLTFIVYLNENFEGGATSFFVPRPEQAGHMEATPVRPVTGFATVFSHGNTGVPLLHEGSPVTEGTKYILRTDVLYESAHLQEILKSRWQVA